MLPLSPTVRLVLNRLDKIHCPQIDRTTGILMSGDAIEMPCLGPFEVPGQDCPQSNTLPVPDPGPDPLAIY
ncbi:unnamed protein product [Calypogeia fissa]